MKTAIVVTRSLVGILGLIQVVLGVLFWAGRATALVQLHMILGLAFVLGLMTLSVLTARVGAPIALAVVAFAWGLVIPAFGMTQMQILPGPLHWVVKVAHLLTGVIGMGLAGALYARSGIVVKSKGGRVGPIESRSSIASLEKAGQR